MLVQLYRLRVVCSLFRSSNYNLFGLTYKGYITFTRAALGLALVMLLLNHASVLLLLLTSGITLLPVLLLLQEFFILLGMFQSGVTTAKGLHEFVHRLGHVGVELLLLRIHLLHVLLCLLNLQPRTVNVLVVFL